MSRAVMTGKVTANRDPLGLARVQVSLAGFNAQVDLPWLRVVSSSASQQAGHLFLPEVGDEVLVLVGGDPSDTGHMFILGALYHRNHSPTHKNEDGDNTIKQIRTRSGNELTFCDKPGEESLTLRSPHAGRDVCITLHGADGSILVDSPGKVVLRGAQLELVATAAIELRAPITSVTGEFKHT